MALVENEDLARIKDMINTFRVAKGVEPLDDIPKGKPASAEYCPIAIGLNFNCKVSSLSVGFTSEEDAGIFISSVHDEALGICPMLNKDGMWRVLLPHYARIFIMYFDSSLLPQYIDPNII